MNRSLAISTMLLVAACSDTANDPTALDVEPSFARAAPTANASVERACGAGDVRIALVTLQWTNLPPGTKTMGGRLRMNPKTFTGFVTISVGGGEMRQGARTVEFMLGTAQVGQEWQDLQLDPLKKVGRAGPLIFPELDGSWPFTHPGCPLP